VVEREPAEPALARAIQSMREMGAHIVYGNWLVDGAPQVDSNLPHRRKGDAANAPPRSVATNTHALFPSPPPPSPPKVLLFDVYKSFDRLAEWKKDLWEKVRKAFGFLSAPPPSQSQRPLSPTPHVTLIHPPPPA
jgi:hypothetical protein